MLRHLVRTGAVLAAWALCAVAWAQPSRITIIVPYPAGGLSDTLARLTADALAKDLRTTVIVENRPGANGVLGLQAVARAAPDGATLGLVPASVMTTNPFLYKDMKVDPLRDVTSLTLALTLPNVLVVNPAVPAASFPELLAWLRAHPGTNYGSMGAGSSAHLNGEMLAHDEGLALTHIPYKGSAPVMQDLVAGHIPMAFDNLPVALPYIQSGKLRAIGLTSVEPSPYAPGVPPISRWLPGFEDNIWFGFIAPGHLPPDVTQRLHDALARAVNSPEVVKPMQERGASVITCSPEEMRKTVAAEQKKWGELIRARQIRVD